MVAINSSVGRTNGERVQLMCNGESRVLWPMRLIRKNRLEISSHIGNLVG